MLLAALNYWRGSHDEARTMERLLSGPENVEPIHGEKDA
jgi:hypothetical protein